MHLFNVSKGAPPTESAKYYGLHKAPDLLLE